MFLQNIVEDLAMYVVEICPRKFAAVYSAKHVEGPYAPVGRELLEVDVGFLFSCDATNFILDGASPIEDGTSDVPCQCLDFGEIGHFL